MIMDATGISTKLIDGDHNVELYDCGEKQMLNVAVLIIAAVSLLSIGYFLLVKSDDSNFLSRRR